MADGPAARMVLVVEDDEEARAGLVAVLRREGYAVTAVGTVEAGLAALRSVGADLVLLTMLLPGRDGWDFLSVRRRDPDLSAVPVVITTKLGVATPEWAESLGARACFRKPYDVAALLAEVRRCLG